MITDWNVAVTSVEDERRYLSREISRFGEFQKAGFRGVLVGKVEDTTSFLEELERVNRENPNTLGSLAEVVPVDNTLELSTYAGFFSFVLLRLIFGERLRDR